MNPVQRAYWIGKCLGWENIPRRLVHEFKTRSGFLERQFVDDSKPISLDRAEIEGRWQNRKTRFLPLPTSEQLQACVDAKTWDAEVGKICRNALAGRALFFSHWCSELGWPPKFNHDPVNDILWPSDTHWTDFARSGPPRNDIKLVWEASRFSLAFYFARNYIYTQEELWGESFWQLFESWVEQNPHDRTAAWACGQEIAFRSFAMIFAAMSLLDCSATTGARLASLEKLCLTFADRISKTIGYAISQKNNHAISEASALWIIGLVFSEYPDAHRWQKLGRKILEKETFRQIYADGSYVQHSMSYHRVMLDDLCLAVQVGRQNGQEFSKQFMERVGSSVVWLSEFVDPNSGRVPNFGSNDGANVLPLSCSDYLDYRPILHAAAKVFDVKYYQLNVGPWSEKAIWLINESREKQFIRSDRSSFWEAPIGGYYVLRGSDSYIFVRAAKLKDRPAQCDMQHVDLWFKGHNVFRDAGSYRYYHDDNELKRYFSSSFAHNTVTFPNGEQMVKGPSFMWLQWPRVDVEVRAPNSMTIRGKYKGIISYDHTRHITRIGNNYTVLDEVEPHGYDLHWKLAPDWIWQVVSDDKLKGSHRQLQCEIVIKHNGSAKLGLEDSWESLYYGQRRKCPTLFVRGLHGPVETRVLFSDGK